MIAILRDFYTAALGAEIAYGPPTAFTAAMSTHYCRMIMALESLAAPGDGVGRDPTSTTDRHDRTREAIKNPVETHQQETESGHG